MDTKSKSSAADSQIEVVTQTRSPNLVDTIIPVGEPVALGYRGMRLVSLMFFLSSALACGSVGALRDDSAGDSDTVVDVASDAGDDAVDAARAGPCLPTREGMVAWWPGEGNASDLLGGPPGTLQGRTRFVTGEVGQAFSLD